MLVRFLFSNFRGTQLTLNQRLLSHINEIHFANSLTNECHLSVQVFSGRVKAKFIEAGFSVCQLVVLNLMLYRNKTHIYQIRKQEIIKRRLICHCYRCSESRS